MFKGDLTGNKREKTKAQHSPQQRRVVLRLPTVTQERLRFRQNTDDSARVSSGGDMHLQHRTVILLLCLCPLIILE